MSIVNWFVESLNGKPVQAIVTLIALGGAVITLGRLIINYAKRRSLVSAIGDTANQVRGFVGRLARIIFGSNLWTSIAAAVAFFVLTIFLTLPVTLVGLFLGATIAVIVLLMRMIYRLQSKLTQPSRAELLEKQLEDLKRYGAETQDRQNVEIIRRGEMVGQRDQRLRNMADKIFTLQGYPAMDPNIDIVYERSLNILMHWNAQNVRKAIVYDSNMRSQFVQKPEKARDYFVKFGFEHLGAAALKQWMREAIETDTAHRSLAVFIQGIFPDSIAEVGNETCTLRQFLDKGGRVVWRGDIPFYYRGSTGRVVTEEGVDWPLKILGVNYKNIEIQSPSLGRRLLWDGDYPMRITAAGNNIGLTIRPAARVVPAENVSLVYSEVAEQLSSMTPALPVTGSFAGCWKKRFNTAHSHGGFMQYFLNRWDGEEMDDMAQYLKFAISDWPLTLSSLSAHPILF